MSPPPAKTAREQTSVLRSDSAEEALELLKQRRFSADFPSSLLTVFSGGGSYRGSGSISGGGVNRRSGVNSGGGSSFSSSSVGSAVGGPRSTLNQSPSSTVQPSTPSSTVQFTASSTPSSTVQPLVGVSHRRSLRLPKFFKSTSSSVDQQPHLTTRRRWSRSFLMDPLPFTSTSSKDPSAAMHRSNSNISIQSPISPLSEGVETFGTAPSSPIQHNTLQLSDPSLESVVPVDHMDPSYASPKSAVDPGSLKSVVDPGSLKSVRDPASLKSVVDSASLKSAVDSASLKSVVDPASLKSAVDQMDLASMVDHEISIDPAYGLNVSASSPSPPPVPESLPPPPPPHQSSSLSPSGSDLFVSPSSSFESNQTLSKQRASTTFSISTLNASFPSSTELRSSSLSQRAKSIAGSSTSKLSRISRRFKGMHLPFTISYVRIIIYEIINIFQQLFDFA
jgi:hypothetical protein